MSTDFDYIRDKFDSDGIHAPDALSEQAMLAALPDRETGTEPDNSQTFTPVRASGGGPKRRNRLIRYAAIAACAVIALTGIPQLYSAIAGVPDTSLVNDELYTFNSYGEIDRLVSKLDKSQDHVFFRLGKGSQDTSTTDGMIEYESATAANADTVGGTASHSDTYLQVEDVDEADIIKTDGKYIYFVNDNAEVVIFSAEKGKTKRLSVIGYNEVENYVSDIFLKGDTLITVGRVYNEDDGYAAVVTYDISDRSDPKVISEFRQTGNVVSSRMVGDYVYLVTSEYVYKGSRVVPMCTVDGTYTKLPVSDICCVPEPVNTSYTILSAIDIASGKQGKSKSKAIFGSASDIYCNDHNLYTAVSEWNMSNDADSTGHTRVIRARLDGTNVKFDATARVRGNIDDQFSMNEKDGFFYIATTSQRNNIDVNNLFVLDENLKEAGSVTGFARNESIRAVRYIGDKAYIITYEQTDPLFIIDLSDPADPKIEGEVKINGFSTLLVPVSEDRLLGIGYDTDENGMGGEFTDGLKLVLFDISDPSEPKVMDTKAFKDADSFAQTTHKALTVNKDAGWFAIPYGKYISTGDEDDYTFDYESGVIVFGAGDKLTIYDEHKLSSNDLYRCVYIDDYIYALDGSAEVSSFRFSK